VISELGIEKKQNEKGLRYRMNRNKKEADEVGRLGGLPGMTVNLPIIGETYIGPPKVASIWEVRAEGRRREGQEERRAGGREERT